MRRVLLLLALLVVLGVGLLQLSQAKPLEMSPQPPAPPPAEVRWGGPPEEKWRGPPDVLYGQTVRVTIRGDGIYASFTLDVLSRDQPSRYGKVVYGVGHVEVGGVQYEVKSIEGWLTQREFRADVYTGKEYVELKVRDGRYVVQIRTLGKPGCVEYSGAATVEIS